MLSHSPSEQTHRCVTCRNLAHLPESETIILGPGGVAASATGIDSTQRLLCAACAFQGIPIDVPTIQGGVFSAGVEVACLLADVALLQMDEVCAEFFQADWCVHYLIEHLLKQNVLLLCSGLLLFPVSKYTVLHVYSTALR